LYFDFYFQSARSEFLGILSMLVRHFENGTFEDMRILVDKDPEMDFFENMRHIQVEYFLFSPFLRSFVVSFLPSFCPSFVPSFLHSFLASLLPCFLAFFLASFLSFFYQSLILLFITLQLHRRVRALHRLEILCNKKSFKPSTLVSFLLPLTTAYLHAYDHNVTAQAIATIGAIATGLPWSKYLYLLKTYLRAMQREKEKQKIVVR